MKWFGNRNREGHEAETADVKPKNQILQIPETQTSEAKKKLAQFRNEYKVPKEQMGLDNQSREVKKRPDGAASKGQKQLELGRATEFE